MNYQPFPPAGLPTPTQVNYYFVCKRKLWFFAHSINMEKESELVAVGRLLHENAYKKEKKEINIAGIMKIDFTHLNKGIIYETKKSKKCNAAHNMQLKYILYILKLLGNPDLKGVLNYPLLKRKEDVPLLPQDEADLQTLIRDINRVIEAPHPPAMVKKRICRKCSYFELCNC